MVLASSLVIRHRKAVIILTAVLCAVFGMMALFVDVNYDMGDYLPSYTPTTRAMGVVQTDMPNLSLYVPGLPFKDAAAEKKALAAIPGVEGVIWLDDALDIRSRPLATLDAGVVSQYYNEGPLFRLTLDEDVQSQTVLTLKERYPDAQMSGVAYGLAQIINVTMKEVSSLMLIIAPLCLLILLLATRHWAEPLLFLVAIGAAIILNEGSNIVFGSVSYITRASSALLQLAVSIDYAVFLLHSFDELREQGVGTNEAMRQAMRRAAASIASSAMTTVFGFLALTLMDFRLGMDMGLVLAKGVLLSYLCVMFVLPAFTVASVKLMDRTKHRSFLPAFRGFGRFVVSRMGPVALIVLLALPVAYLAQSNNRFLYGTGGMHSPDSPVHVEQRAIEERFGTGRMALLLVPEGDRLKESELAEELRRLPYVASVMSYADAVSLSIPPQVLPESASGAFYTGGYARLILTLSTAQESATAFEVTTEIRETAARFYPDESHMLGETAVNLDLRNVITRDSVRVLLAGILSIGIVLLINFRNLTIPLILLTVIEGSIWLNMGLPYLMGQPLNYIGYLIVSSVQLGATVDYGILLTQRYLEYREESAAREAAARAVAASAGSVIPPAMILTIAGFSLKILVPDNGIISELGLVLGRGTLLSLALVLLVLPVILVWSDGLIRKTMLKKKAFKHEN